MISTLNAVTAGGGLALPEFIELAKNNGFRGVEFPIGAVADIIERDGADAFAVFDGAGIAPAAFGLPVEWRKDEETFRSGLEGLPRLARAAQQVGCARCCTWVVPDGTLPVAEYRAQSTARFVEIARILGDYGVHLGLEFLGPAHFRANPDNVWFYDIAGGLEVADEVGQKAGTNNVGLLVDCWHWYTSGGTIMDLASIPVEQIVHVHINDAPDTPRDEQKDSVRLLPGESGVIDIRGFLQTLKALGYEGPVAVETFSEELKQLSPQEAAGRAGAAVNKVFDEAGI
jgi:sugar phosphate isomerase/epimerase